MPGSLCLRFGKHKPLCKCKTVYWCFSFPCSSSLLGPVHKNQLLLFLLWPVVGTMGHYARSSFSLCQYSVTHQLYPPAWGAGQPSNSHPPWNWSALLSHQDLVRVRVIGPPETALSWRGRNTGRPVSIFREALGEFVCEIQGWGWDELTFKEFEELGVGRGCRTGWGKVKQVLDGCENT